MTRGAEADGAGPAVVAERRSGQGQAFWTIVVAVPAVLSLLRIWIEAGGQLQTTLLIVANVNTVNLFASMFLVGTRSATMALVAVFAVGGLLGVSATAARDLGRPLRRRPLFARWAEATPVFLLVATFALAALTWPILYLPLLAPAFVMAFQAVPSYSGFTPVERAVAYVIFLIAYAWAVGPAVAEANHQDNTFVVVMVVLPPLVVPFAGGTVPRDLTRTLARIGQPVILVAGFLALLPAATVPVLPLTVTTVSAPGERSDQVRGYVISSDDELTAILQEGGGIRYVSNDTIDGRVLCPSEEELPMYRIWVRNLHVEDSLLEAWGRQRRPAATTDAACRSTPYS